MARVSITEKVHQQLRAHVGHGEVVIDATLGNGHDALFLAGLIGEDGKLFGFDIQSDAIEATENRLRSNNMLQRVELYQQGHEMMAELVPELLHGHVSAIVYNLGYLPGGDKSLTTETAATISSLKQACELLKPNGVISLLAYTGHPGGMEECLAVKAWAGSLEPERFRVNITNLLPDHHYPPEWIWIEKRPL